MLLLHTDEYNGSIKRYVCWRVTKGREGERELEGGREREIERGREKERERKKEDKEGRVREEGRV